MKIQKRFLSFLYSSAHSAPPSNSILSITVNNDPGVLARVAGILASRNFNITSLAVASTHCPSLSRMTIAINGTPQSINHAINHLNDVVPVHSVNNLSHMQTIQREILMAKINTEADTLAETSIKRSAVSSLAQSFGGTTVDVSHTATLIQLCAKPSKIDAFINLIKPFGIIDLIRSGVMAMPRSDFPTEEVTQEQEESPSVDATMLPPG